jgi:ParB-like chromosome segregation protein Spo0J
MIELHPLCTLFPRMSDDEFKNLKLDIDKNGLLEPIITYNNMILDGGNRYKACLEIGLMPTFKEYDIQLGNIGDFILSKNLYRRHITLSQQAAIVASVSNWAGSTATHGTNRHTSEAVETVKDRAAKSGASVATQRKADYLAKADLNLAKDVAIGAITLNDALKQVSPVIITTKKEEYSETQRLKDDLNELKDLIADQQIQIATQAYTGDEIGLTDIIESLRIELRDEQLLRQTVESQRDAYLKENQELKKQVTFWRKKSENKGY